MTKVILTILVGLAGGLAIGASITAFFVVLGVTARIIQWTKREEYLLFFQISMILGAMLSCFVYFFDFSIKHLKFISVPLGFLMGVFVGTIVAALTETLDIISVAAKKLNATRWVYLIVIVVLLGKVFGSLLFFLIPGFF